MFIMRLIVFINGQLSERCVLFNELTFNTVFLKQKQIKSSHFQTLKKVIFCIKENSKIKSKHF